MYWLISANPKYYKHFEAFNDNGFVDWHQIGNYSVGDTVFIYTTKPYQLITFETTVEKVDIPVDLAFDDSKYWIEESMGSSYKTYMRLRLVNSFMNESLSYDNLLKNGLKYAPQGKMRLEGELLDYILRASKNHSYLEEDISSDDNRVVDNILTSKRIIDVEVSMIPPKPIESSKGIVWPRNAMYKAIALKKANYMCEVDNNHPTFVRKVSNVGYTEAHHLIPLAAQGEDRFKDVNLDCLENIVSLCSNCHNQIHYGKDVEEIITKLYNLRKKKLTKRGINIDLKDLLKYYE